VSSRHGGFSYLEVLIATLLIAVALVPMMDALRPGIQGSKLHKQRAEIHYVLAGKLETVLAEPFVDLDEAATAAGSATSPTSYSDLAADIPYQVYIWRYDADNADADADVFSGGEDDILWVSVSLADASQSLQTLITPY
jgi:Tfp pilus assembly protein PilV